MKKVEQIREVETGINFLNRVFILLTVDDALYRTLQKPAAANNNSKLRQAAHKTASSAAQQTYITEHSTTNVTEQ